MSGGGSSATTGSTSTGGLSDSFSLNEGEIMATPNLKIYSFSDMKTATKSFKSDTVLGIGGFGTVFKGWVDEKTLAPSRMGTGIIVAIKKLNPESMQGFDEWQVYIYIISYHIICRYLGTANTRSCFFIYYYVLMFLPYSLPTCIASFHY